MNRKQEICEQVTAEIIEALKKGTAPWHKPWATKPPHNPVTGTMYRGMNFLLLAMRSHSYKSSGWITFLQAQKLGGSVKKGSKGVSIFKPIYKEEEDDKGKKTTSFFVKVYTVFNLDQCENLPESVYTTTISESLEGTEQERAESLIQACLESGANIREQGSRACLVPSLDSIFMPMRQSFKDDANYAATLSHELVHWTGMPTRLDRELLGDKASASYAYEELVAELGAAFLSAAFGLKSDLQHVEYIGEWITQLKNDSGLIMKASSQAQKAFAYLMEIPSFKERALTIEAMTSESDEDASAEPAKEAAVAIAA